MSKLSKSRQRLNAVRPANILALKGKKIGPLFPEMAADWDSSSRGVPRKKTKSPFTDKYRALRAVRRKIANISRRKNRS